MSDSHHMRDPSTVAEVYVQAVDSKILTLADRHRLQAAILGQDLHDTDYHRIDRLLHALRQGKLQMSDFQT